MSGKVIQGWHSDPFGVHEDRYFSADGEPTKLVRDRGAESYDEPPSGADEVAAAMAALAAAPEPPRDAYSYGLAAEREPRRRSAVPAFVAAGAVLAGAAVAVVLVAHPMAKSPKPASTLGLTDVAFVTQAATRTLQQRTAELVMSGSGTGSGTNTSVQGTGAVDLGGKTGTLNLTTDTKTGVTVIREIWLNGEFYFAVTANGKSPMPAGKTWIAEQVPSQESQSAATDLTGDDPTAALAALENKGISVRAIGTKVIGGVTCTGYLVTPPGGLATVTVWIDPQHLLRELSENATVNVSASVDVASGTATSTVPVGKASALSMQMTMDLSYSAAPLQVTAPPAASTISFDDFLNQLK